MCTDKHTHTHTHTHPPTHANTACRHHNEIHECPQTAQPWADPGSHKSCRWSGGGEGEGQGQRVSSRGQKVNCRALPPGPFIIPLTQTDYPPPAPSPPPPHHHPANTFPLLSQFALLSIHPNLISFCTPFAPLPSTCFSWLPFARLVSVLSLPLSCPVCYKR